MPKDATDRRERMHDLLVIEGRPEAEVVDEITDEFGVAAATARNDLRSVDEWIGDLVLDDPTGASRIRELREARGRLYDLALEVREAGDADLERKVVRDIVDAIATDVDLSQSLGLAVDAEAAGAVPLPADVDEDDPLADLADRDPAVVPPGR